MLEEIKETFVADTFNDGKHIREKKDEKTSPEEVHVGEFHIFENRKKDE